MNRNIFSSRFVVNEMTWLRLARMLQSEDDIGIVLRAHLITENMIEAWCCASTNNESLFEGFGENLTMTYAAKLQLASNLGLNQFSVAELKRINKIRNARSHQIDNTQITDAEIQSLMTLIRNGGQDHLVNTKDFGLAVDGKKVYLNRPSSNNREKFLAILGAVFFRATEQAIKS